MRARLMMKLMAIVVLLILSVMGARSCSATPRTSPVNPVNVQNNAVAGYCANQQITDEASGGAPAPPATVASPLQSLAQNLGVNFDCPTTTVDNSGG